MGTAAARFYDIQAAATATGEYDKVLQGMSMLASVWT